MMRGEEMSVGLFAGVPCSAVGLEVLDFDNHMQMYEETSFSTSAAAHPGLFST